MFKKIFVSISTYLLAANVSAGELVKIPTEWRVDNKSDGTIEAFYTGSNCANGSLVMDNSVSEDFKNRFVSIVLAAKATSSKIQVFYYRHDATDVCNITNVVIPRASEPLN